MANTAFGDSPDAWQETFVSAMKTLHLLIRKSKKISSSWVALSDNPERSGLRKYGCIAEKIFEKIYPTYFHSHGRHS